MLKSTAGGLRFLCERCTVILASDFSFLTENPHWIRVKSPKKNQKVGGRYLDFCSVKCKLIFFKGRKYISRKHRHIQSNLDKLYTNFN